MRPRRSVPQNLLSLTGRLLHRRRWLIAVGVVLAGGAIGLLIESGSIRTSIDSAGLHDHLGGEHDNIARAILEGRGFADPFNQKTGPTAWMPPVVPTFVALLYWITGGNREHVVAAFFGVQLAMIMLNYSILLNHTGSGKETAIMSGAIALASFSLFVPLFIFTHAHCFEMSATTMVWLCTYRCYGSKFDGGGKSNSLAILSGLAGGICALVAPAVAIAWACVTTSDIRRRPVSVVISLLVAFVIVSPWIGRNYRVFGTLIPVKSNASFEAWQALVIDHDGILDAQSLSQHPYSGRGITGHRYREVGEKEFLREKRQEYFDAAGKSKRRFLYHIGNRVYAAFIGFRPGIVDIPQSSLLYVANQVWKFAVTISIVYLILLRHSLSYAESSALAIVFLTMLPYLLVSYYERYSWPLLPMHLLIVFSTCKRLLERYLAVTGTSSRLNA